MPFAPDLTLKWKRNENNVYRSLYHIKLMISGGCARLRLAVGQIDDISAVPQPLRLSRHYATVIRVGHEGCN